MRTAVFTAILLLVPAAFAETPEEAFNDLLDAVYSGDAEGVTERLSTGTLAMLDMVVAMIRLQPGEAAEEFSHELGTDITPGEIMNWTAADFIDAVILSPGFIDELPPRDQIAISHCVVNGDSSTVFLSVAGISDQFGMAMVLEDDSWRLSENLIQGPLQ